MNPIDSFPLQTRKEIIQWLKSHDIEDYKIDNDLVVSIGESVWLERKNLDRLPFQFGSVNGSFTLHQNQLTTLKGSPHTVLGSFVINNNLLTTLEYAPKWIEEGFLVSDNQLTNLDYIPTHIGGMLDFSLNPIHDIIHLNLDFQKIQHVSLNPEGKLIGFENHYIEMPHGEQIVYFFEMEKEIFQATCEKYHLDNQISNTINIEKVKTKL